jgi:hypothetical protein
MKDIKKNLLSALVVFVLQFGLFGCVAEVGGGGYYREGPWYHDGPWMDGPGWNGGPRGHVDIDIHPPGFRR